LELSITLIIVIITVITSVIAFSNPELKAKLIFHPPAVANRQEWWRFFTCGLIHADIQHLAFNMYSFYLFGEQVEDAFRVIFGQKGRLVFLLLYVLALGACLLPTYKKHEQDYGYFSLGASGAVSAIIFAGVLLFPTAGIGLLFIPFLKLPAFIFGGIYLVVTYILDRRGRDNINHSAHLWGAVFGMAFLVVVGYAASNYPVLQSFVDQVRAYLNI
jgi:membrane associated rhomboid family serine protease